MWTPYNFPLSFSSKSIQLKWFDFFKLFLFIPFHRPAVLVDRLPDLQFTVRLFAWDQFFSGHPRLWIPDLKFGRNKRLGRETCTKIRSLKGSWNQKLLGFECPSRILLENRIYTGHKLSYIARQLFLIKSNNNHYLPDIDFDTRVLTSPNFAISRTVYTCTDSVDMIAVPWLVILKLQKVWNM